MTLKNFSLLSSLLLAACASAQGQNVLSVFPPERVSGKAGQPMEARLTLKLKPGYHVNSNTPSDEYLIPLRLTWTGIETVEVVFPKPTSEKYSFSEKPLSVFSGEFVIVSKLRAAAAGVSTATAKLRYQACNDSMCLPPKTIELQIPVSAN